jgi:hypothetical protein
MPERQIRPLTKTRAFWVNVAGFVSVIGSVWSSLNVEQKQVLATVVAMLWAALANWAKAKERYVADGSPAADAIRNDPRGDVAPPRVEASATGEQP